MFFQNLSVNTLHIFSEIFLKFTHRYPLCHTQPQKHKFRHFIRLRKCFPVTADFFRKRTVSEIFFHIIRIGKPHMVHKRRSSKSQSQIIRPLPVSFIMAALQALFRIIGNFILMKSVFSQNCCRIFIHAVLRIFIRKIQLPFPEWSSFLHDQAVCGNMLR